MDEEAQVQALLRQTARSAQTAAPSTTASTPAATTTTAPSTSSASTSSSTSNTTAATTSSTASSTSASTSAASATPSISSQPSTLSAASSTATGANNPFNADTIRLLAQYAAQMQSTANHDLNDILDANRVLEVLSSEDDVALEPLLALLPEGQRNRDGLRQQLKSPQMQQTIQRMNSILNR